MSHDRGCHCGKEGYEYAECTRMDCTKTNNRRKSDRKASDSAEIPLVTTNTSAQPQQFILSDLQHGITGAKTSLILRGYNTIKRGPSVKSGSQKAVTLGELVLQCTVKEGGKSWEITLGNGLITWELYAWTDVEYHWKAIQSNTLEMISQAWGVPQIGVLLG